MIKNKIDKQMADNRKLFQQEIDKLNNKIDNLDAKLTKHISFIESVYAPLSNSIDKFKKFFK